MYIPSTMVDGPMWSVLTINGGHTLSMSMVYINVS